MNHWLFLLAFFSYILHICDFWMLKLIKMQEKKLHGGDLFSVMCVKNASLTT
jgi:hypothetical protein